eukprot:m.43917 g.43917  ORF g.43917 m.43917 type:complete len:182 (-) comp10571_c0_seq2:121-666(-)
MMLPVMSVSCIRDLALGNKLGMLTDPIWGRQQIGLESESLPIDSLIPFSTQFPSPPIVFLFFGCCQYVHTFFHLNRGEDKPFAVCVFMPLITLNKTVGFTQFWPGSHKYDELIGFGAVCPLLECELDAIVDVGNAVVYDYRLIHRGMPNMSSGTERPLIQFLYHVPQYVENRNYGKESLFG